MSPIRLRKAIRFGPLVFNLTQRGLSSVSLRMGPLSLNSRRRRLRADLPGPFFWEGPMIRRPAPARTEEVER